MKKIIIKTFTLLFCIVLGLQAKAQLNPFQAMYFQNPYLYNSSMAGVDSVLTINTGYKKQWGSFPGTPKTALLTAEYQPTKKVGIGLNVTDDQAGLIRQTRVVGTYAYHLPVGPNNQKLHFGISVGYDDSKIDYNKIEGDLSDEEIDIYNQLKGYVDGDFGGAYTDNKLYLGVAFPSIKSSFFEPDLRFGVNKMTFIGMASYKFALQKENNEFVLQPLLGYRIVKGYDNILDAGVNFAMNNYGIYTQVIYHSSKSLGLGLGFDRGAFALNLTYMQEMGSLRTYTKGAFEFGLKLRLFRN